jgi:hypothetical protein
MPNISRLEIQAEKRERTFIKLIVGGISGVALAVALGYLGIHFFHRWQEGRLVRRAAAYLGGGDTKAAELSARRALQMDPANADAARILAKIADRQGDRMAIDWWRKVTILQPHRTEDALALAQSALRAQDIATAEKALNGLDNPGRQSAQYHASMGHLAEVKKESADAEHHWQKATELEPNNGSYQFQLASIRLGATDPSKRQNAREALGNLRQDPQLRAGATRLLVLDGLGLREEPGRLRALANELQGYPEASFGDRLLYLQVLQNTRDAAFNDYLLRLEREAGSHPADLASLLSWMAENGIASEAVQFARELPRETWEKWPVAAALATAYVSTGDWSGLEQLTATSQWTPFDFLRQAYLSKALREQNKRFASEQAWVAAEKEAFAQPQSLLLLARTATAWGWSAEKVELLWLLAKNDETKLAALQTLYQHYSDIGDTVGLYRTLLRLVELMPNDLVLQNNSAQISLLLGTDLERAYRVAADLSNKEPSNAAYVSTYAFSLYIKGDTKGALSAMDRLSPEQLHTPSIAIYYGVILAAAGQKDKARDYLRAVSEANLLPEEKALAHKARDAAD